MPRYDAVQFDLLTALLDSWTLWNAVAGAEDSGRRWRVEYLRITHATGAYRPYEDLVAESAEPVGLDRSIAASLDARYDQRQPWPGRPDTGTACGWRREAWRRYQLLAPTWIPVGRIDAVFDCVITAEDAGCYKPDPRTYRLALDKLRVTPDRCLFVAGSAYDLITTRSASRSNGMTGSGWKRPTRCPPLWRMNVRWRVCPCLGIA